MTTGLKRKILRKNLVDTKLSSVVYNQEKLYTLYRGRGPYVMHLQSATIYLLKKFRKKRSTTLHTVEEETKQKIKKLKRKCNIRKRRTKKTAQNLNNPNYKFVIKS